MNNEYLIGATIMHRGEGGASGKYTVTALQPVSDRAKTGISDFMAEYRATKWVRAITLLIVAVQR